MKDRVEPDAAVLDEDRDLHAELLATLLFLAVEEADDRATVGVGTGLTLNLGRRPYRAALRASWTFEPEGHCEVLENRFLRMTELAANDPVG